MKKKYILLTILVALPTLFFLFRKHFRNPLGEVAPLYAVPNSSPFVLEIKDLNTLKATLAAKPYSAALGKSPFINEMLQNVSVLDSFLQQLSANKKNIAQPFWVAAQVNGAKNFDYLYIFEGVSSNFDTKNIKKHLKKSVFKGQDVFTFKRTDAQQLSFCIFKNLLIVAEQSFLVEDAIAQLDQVATSVPHENSFVEISTTNEKNVTGVNLYLNFKNLPLLLTTLVRGEKQPNTEFLAGGLAWAKLQPDFQENGIVVQGTASVATKEEGWLQQLAGETAANNDFKMANVLPDNTASVSSFFSVSLLKKIANQNPNHPFSNYIFPISAGEFAHILLEPSSLDYEKDRFILLKIKDQKLAAEAMLTVEKTLGVAETIDYQIFKIKKIVSDDLLHPLGFHIKHPYYTLIDDYILFGKDASVMRTWIDKYIASMTLSRDSTFLNFKNNFNVNYNYILYNNTNRLFHFAKAFAHDDLQPQIAQYLQPYMKFGQAALQLRANHNGTFQAEGLLQYATEKRHSANVAWRTDLNVPLAIEPQVAKDPFTNDHYVIVQDTSLNVYLIDKNGNILWKKNIEDKIISKVEMLDYYGNKKAQFLFNTKKNIYLLDKDSRDIGNYPLPLHSEATNGLLLTNYHNDGKYRMFIACENGNIYGYYKDGQPVSGWNPQMKVGKLRQPLLHFLANKKDYLVALNEKGELRCFKPNGQLHFNPISLGVSSKAEFDYDDFDQSRRLVVSDEKGKIKVVNLENGSTFNLATPVGTNKNVRFAFVDIANDGRKDYAVLEQNKLLVYGYDSQNKFVKIAEKTLPEEQDALFAIGLLAEGTFNLGAYNKAKRRIYLFDNQLNVKKGFPLAGSGVFKTSDLFSDGSSVVVVADRSSLYAYKIE